jgi:hypothetical protein
MGYLSPDQETARATQQGANVKALYDSLAAQIAGIQQASVGQANAGSAALGAANTATGATAAPVSGALGVAIPGVQGSQGAQTVLGAQGAAQGNLLGSLQANSYAAGTSGQKAALAAGQSNIATNEADSQKTLAQLMAGLDPVSKRASATCSTANGRGRRRRTCRRRLGIYQGFESAKSNALLAGQKDAYNKEVLDEKKWEAGQSNATKKALGIAADKTKILTTNATQTGATTRAKTAAAARVKAAGLSAAARKAAADKAAATSTANNKRTNQTRRDTTGATAAGGTFKNYKVTVDIPQADKPGKVDKLTGLPGTPIKQPARRVSKPVPAAVWKKFLASGPPGKRNFAILGVPKGSNVTASTGY